MVSDMKNPFVEQIRTVGKYRNMDLYTKNQLKKMGMVPKKTAKKYDLWTNSYKQRKAEYFEISDCRAMTHQEEIAYKDNQVKFWRTKYLDLAKIVLSGNSSEINEWKIQNQYMFSKNENE